MPEILARPMPDPTLPPRAARMSEQDARLIRSLVASNAELLHCVAQHLPTPQYVGVPWHALPTLDRSRLLSIAAEAAMLVDERTTGQVVDLAAVAGREHALEQYRDEYGDLDLLAEVLGIAISYAFQRYELEMQKRCDALTGARS